MGKIFYLMGKSASGKDTVYKRLVQECPGFSTIILYVTRPKRAGETDGVEYHFTTEEGLEAFRTAGKVIEQRTYQTVAGPWTYATVDDGQIDLGRGDYLAIGTLESYRCLRDYFGQEAVVPLYITVDDGVRLERALARERQQPCPNYAELCRRYLADEEDFSREKLAEAGVTVEYGNEELEACVGAIRREIDRLRH